MRWIRYTVALLLLLATVAGMAQNATLQTGLALKYLVQLPVKSAGKAPVIILLHGYGSNEQDLFEFKKVLPQQYIVITARAPMSMPNGGFKWYDFISVSDKHLPNADEVAASRALLEKFVKQVVDKYHADPKQVYMMGFSQGAVMSYETGLSNPGMLKGIAAFSGKMHDALKKRLNAKNAPKELRIFISHGTADNVIKFEEATDADNYLRKIGLKPEFHRYNGMTHAISNDVLKDLLKWLTQ